MCPVATGTSPCTTPSGIAYAGITTNGTIQHELEYCNSLLGVAEAEERFRQLAHQRNCGLVPLRLQRLQQNVADTAGQLTLIRLQVERNELEMKSSEAGMGGAEESGANSDSALVQRDGLGEPTNLV